MVLLYSLLYVPIAGLAGLCLFGTVKLVKERQKHSHKSLLSISGAMLAVTLFTAGYAVMVVTHTREHKIAMAFMMLMATVNILRTNTLPMLLRYKLHE